MIAALRALSEASGLPSDSRQSQCDIVLVAASLAGLALLGRSGRLNALGFSAEEILARLDKPFRQAVLNSGDLRVLRDIAALDRLRLPDLIHAP